MRGFRHHHFHPDRARYLDVLPKPDFATDGWLTRDDPSMLRAAADLTWAMGPWLGSGPSACQPRGSHFGAASGGATPLRATPCRTPPLWAIPCRGGPSVSLQTASRTRS